MKTIEDLPVNEWNYQVPTVDPTIGNYRNYVVPGSGNQGIPSEVPSDNSITEEAGSPTSVDVRGPSET